MGHIDWLVDRDGVMFAADLPGAPADDASEIDNAKQNRSKIGRPDNSNSDPEQMEVGDPRDGP